MSLVDQKEDAQFEDDEPNEMTEMKLQRQTSSEMLAAHGVDEDMLKPLKFAACIVHRPCVLYCSIFVLLIIITILDGLFFEFNLEGIRVWFVEDDIYTIGYDAMVLVADKIVDDSSSEVYPQTEQDNFWSYHFMFQLASYKGDLNPNKPGKTDYWLLTPDNIETIIKYENKIVNDKEWNKRFCYAGETPLDTNYSCTWDSENYGIASPARYIAEKYNYSYSSMNVNDIKIMVLNKVSDPNSHWTGYFNPYVNETGQIWIYRSFLHMARPISNTEYSKWEIDNATGTIVHESDFATAEFKLQDQSDEFIEWGTPFFAEIVADEDGGLKVGELEIMIFSFAIWQEYSLVLINASMGLIMLSLITVLTYMSIHTQSIFLSSMALFQIFMSFPLAYFVYGGIFQISNFDIMSTLIIFVLLGVGADDVFVFTDAWSQSVHFVPDPNSLVERMTFAFRRASKAMFVTQVTTYFAFLATAASPIMPIAAFGIWASTIIAMNYVLVITMYPPVLVMHHKWIKNWEHPCLCFCCSKCNCCKNKGKGDVSSPKHHAAAQSDTDADIEADIEDQKPPITRIKSVEEQSEEYRFVEKLLGVHFAGKIIRFRRYILALFVVLFALGIWGAASLEALSKQENSFADNHYMQRVHDMTSEFTVSDADADIVEVFLTFGMKDVNRDGTDYWDPEDIGKIVWDKHFDISSADAQVYFKEICADLKKSSLVYNGDDSVFCPITQFEYYLNATNQLFPYVSSNNAETQKQDFAKEFNTFLDGDYGSTTKSQSLAFVSYNDDDQEYTVRFVGISIQSSLAWSADTDDTWDVLDEWEDYVKDIKKKGDCPDNMCDSIFLVSLRWPWLVTQQAFVTSAIQGILIAMPIAFVILLLSTRNWVVSLFAILDIIGIMLCELGIMAAQGWDLGTIECISIIIIIGFSVDYVVHLANSYLESSAENREERLSFALMTIGVSVVSGAITTFGSGMFLVFSDFVFFIKMGILMMTTIVVSLFFAMFFFTSLLAEWGPQGDFGSITPYLLWIRERFACICPKKKDEEDDEQGIEMD